jgi:hypothetical protein
MMNYGKPNENIRKKIKIVDHQLVMHSRPELKFSTGKKKTEIFHSIGHVGSSISAHG